MMNLTKIVKLLKENNITCVLIGGLAMRLYNSPRVTNDIDLAVRTLDVDAIIDLMYANGSYMVRGVDDDSFILSLSPEQSADWI